MMQFVLKDSLYDHASATERMGTYHCVRAHKLHYYISPRGKNGLAS